jgi:pimeloyl-ACP methyl ester carboxylesterase
MPTDSALLVPHTSVSLPANGVPYHVHEWSSPTSPTLTHRRTVVLVHGYLDAGGTWSFVAPTLAAAGFRVLAPDMRGFGRSGRLREGAYYHFADYVFDLADVLDALANEGAVDLVGHSMGGTIATLLAGTFPERVRSLTLVEGVGPEDSPWASGPKRMRRWIEQVRAGANRDPNPRMTPEQAQKRLAIHHPRVPEDVLARLLPHLTHTSDDGHVTWHFDPVHRTTSPGMFFSDYYSEFAKNVRCPVLFVSGGPTGFHPDDEAQRLGSFGTLEQVEILDAGHMVHWTRPEALAAALLAHLQKE